MKIRQTITLILVFGIGTIFYFMVVSLPVVNSQDINPEDGVSFSFDSPVGKF